MSEREDLSLVVNKGDGGWKQLLGEPIRETKDFVLKAPRRFLPGLETYCNLVYGGGYFIAVSMLDKGWPTPVSYPDALLKAESYLIVGFGGALLGAKVIRDYVSAVIDFTAE